MKRLSNW